MVHRAAKLQGLFEILCSLLLLRNFLNNKNFSALSRVPIALHASRYQLQLFGDTKMKVTSFLIPLAVASVTSAQYYNETSEPFYLVVTSDDGSINDTLSACHVGAALESLCLSHSNTSSKPNPLSGVAFHFNTSENLQPPAPSLGKPGILTWFLPSNPPIPSSVTFSYDPTTDIALPILFPGSETPQIMSFDAEDQLTITGYIDWSVSPPSGTGGFKEYHRWYACETYFGGYTYEALAWGLGPGTPENPSCVAVKVTRVFVASG